MPAGPYSRSTIMSSTRCHECSAEFSRRETSTSGVRRTTDFSLSASTRKAICWSGAGSCAHRLAGDGAPVEIRDRRRRPRSTARRRAPGSRASVRLRASDAAWRRLSHADVVSNFTTLACPPALDFDLIRHEPQVAFTAFDATGSVQRETHSRIICNRYATYSDDCSSVAWTVFNRRFDERLSRRRAGSAQRSFGTSGVQPGPARVLIVGIGPKLAIELLVLRELVAIEPHAESGPVGHANRAVLVLQLARPR